MRTESVIKAFKAVSKTTVIKQFLSEPVFPDGWYKSAQEALDAFSPEGKEDAPRKAGRPRKAE